MSSRIGFMQGRLSDLVGGKIQAFPWNSWQEEFALAAEHGFDLMEWTLDQERLYENPLMTDAGQNEIRNLCRRNKIEILSLTGDCFMQAPFWKAEGRIETGLKADFIKILDACAVLGIRLVVVPLVDNGSIETSQQEDKLREFLLSHSDFLERSRIKIVFESDLPPALLARFINSLPEQSFGINYDTGNSAALGFDPKEEIREYGHRIGNVHIKDRRLGGTTVPLGDGDTDFETVFYELHSGNYCGNYILQTARAADNAHLAALCKFRDMTKAMIAEAANRA